MKFKIGLGYDVHQLVEHRKLFLGGLEIPHQKGALGHSDADVLLHAICDALLGAAGFKDIGHQFPNTDAQYKDIDSKILLAKTHALIQSKQYKINNIDATLLLEKPKIAPYIDQMRENIATILSLDLDDISIKATTTETLGYEGRQEGLTAMAVVLLIKH
jgi:2-C-methyl-D-erythritol 2,4-cyclodiphosphate synthase